MRKASVKIVSFSENGVSASAAAGRISTGEMTALQAFEKSGDREKDLKLIGKVLSSGHNTIIEHIYLTVAFNDVSVLTEQLMIEHRIASYTVKSRRYVDFTGAGFLVPDDLCERENEYRAHMEYLFSVYDKLLRLGIPREDARFVLPYCFRSNFLMSANLREMLLVAGSMLNGRLSALPEIKYLGEMLLGEISKYFPAAEKALPKPAKIRETLKEIYQIASPEIATPNAELINSPGDSLKLLNETLSFGEKQLSSFKELIQSERPRELEALCYGFIIKDVSLASVTHFTRHRIQSLIVPDIINALESNKYIMPDSIDKNIEAKRLYLEAFAKNGVIAKSFTDKNDILRYFALAGNTVNIMLGMNARELLHFLRLRCCQRAQWEIRALAQEMLCLLMGDCAELFRYYGPSCQVLGYCPEGRLSCGRIAKAEVK